MTSRECEQMTLLELTSGVSDSPVKMSVSPENRAVLGRETVQDCFFQLVGLLGNSKKKADLQPYSSRTLKTYLALTEGLISPEFSLNWMNSGTMQNGRFLTAKISGCRKTVKECTLSDILEDEVPRKYFLSKKAVDYITREDRKGYLTLHDVYARGKTELGAETT